MATNVPDSSFSEQVNAPEVAERGEPEPVYLSEDSEPEDTQPEEGFATGVPGFASRSTFHRSFETVIPPEVDTKLPASPTSSSKHDSDSEFEVAKSKKKIVRLKMSETTLEDRKQSRVNRNTEHGLNKPSKKPKKMELWEYTDQKLSPDLMLQILPTPTDSFVFRKAMTMKEVEKEVSTQNIDNTLLSVLNKFSAPLCTTIKLSDIQTERSGFLMFRRVVVRKRLGPGQYSYAVMPNLVISSKKKVYHKAQGVWYEKSTTNNRSKEMAIPKPFQGNQSVDVLFDNTFSWDV